MNKRALKADTLLLLTACLWGFGFVAQRSGMEHIGPFAFNGIRFILGSLALIPLVALRARGQKNFSVKKALPGIIIAGGCCFTAVTLQQLGLMFTTAGNAGFITGLYVVLTPIFGIFLGRKTGPATWIGTIFTLTGLYFISAAGQEGRLNPGDILMAAGAVFWACHVLIIDAQVKKIDSILFSSGQFMLCGILALAASFIVEPALAEQLNPLQPGTAGSAARLFEWIPLPSLLSGLYSGTVPAEVFRSTLVPLLYGGLISVGIAHTLQVVAQKNAPPAHATIILCLEGCFAALGGSLLLHEPMKPWTAVGFILMLLGMLVSQWEIIKKT